MSSAELPSHHPGNGLLASATASDALMPQQGAQADLSLPSHAPPSGMHMMIPNHQPPPPSGMPAGMMPNPMPTSVPTTGSPTPTTSAMPPTSPPIELKPNRTLYVNNLNSKIKTDKLKKELTAMFENFGEVRDVIAMKSFWRRGQAWVIFATQEGADKALAGLQGFPYNNKEMKIQYAKEISDIFAKEDGTFVERPAGPKKPRAIIEREQVLQGQLQQFQQLMSQHMQTLQQSGQPLQMLPMGQGLPQGPSPANQIPPAPPGIPMAQPGMSQPQIGHQQLLGQPAMGMLPPNAQIPLTQPPPPPPLSQGAPSVNQNMKQFGGQSNAGPPMGMSKESMVAAAAAAAAHAVEAAAKKRAADAASPMNKMARTTGPMGDEGGFSRGFSSAPPVPAVPIPTSGFFGGPPGSTIGTSGAPPLPNQILFVENLPDDCNVKILESIFHQYPGCRDIRYVESRKIAFVEYETVPQASVALRYLNNFQIKDEYNLRVSYAK